MGSQVLSVIFGMAFVLKSTSGIYILLQFEAILPWLYLFGGGVKQFLKMQNVFWIAL